MQRPLRRSRSFKVTDFGTNRKLIYDFLLVINSHLLSCTVSKLWLIMSQIFASEWGVHHFNAFAGVIPCQYLHISYVAPKPPKGGSKTQNGRFTSKIAVRLKKRCYKISLCENCQRQSCKAFIGLTIHAKTISGGDPFYLKF